MYAAALGCVIAELEPRLVRVEVDVSRGLPSFEVIGRPATVVKESRERVRAALRNCGLDYPPRRITVNLAPSDFPKSQAFLDLPIALGVLAASGQIKQELLQGCIFAGELSLGGDLRPLRGSLAVGLLAAKQKYKLVCPVDNLGELEHVAGLVVAGFTGFSGLLRALVDNALDWRSIRGLPRQKIVPTEDPWMRKGILGGGMARRCLQIAAAGRHNLALVGPPGVGKTLLAHILPELLPPLAVQESLEVAGIYSAIGLPVDKLLQGVPPTRAPHHSLTRAGLIGGGVPVRPGELTLAHRGALFLDETPLFARSSLEALREPLETKWVVLSRAGQQILLPADVQLITAFNLCPCGSYYFRPERCCCTAREIASYLKPMIGPLADRIDLRLAMARPLWEEADQGGTSDFPVSIAAARSEILRRGSQGQEKRLRQSALPFLRHLTHYSNLSARAYFKLIAIASTISALEASETVTEEHLAQAWLYRWELPGFAGGGVDAVV